jgi:hypothetical protein
VHGTPRLAGVVALYLSAVSLLYLAALLSLVLRPYAALAGAISVGVAVALLWPAARRASFSARDVAGVAAGLALVLWTRPPRLDHISWDVVSYGLMRYAEMKHGIVGPYFSYGHVYEFIVSYINQLAPPVAGLTIGHTFSLVLLAGAVVYYATRSIIGLAIGLALLFFDPMAVLDYAAAGKNDVVLAAVVLLVWARIIDERPISNADLVVTSALAASAVGIKTSAVLALAVPLVVYWRDAWAQARRDPRVLAAVASVWLFFCWQYLANVVVLGSATDARLSLVGMVHSPLGALVTWAYLTMYPGPSETASMFVARFSPGLLVIILALAALVISAKRITGRAVAVRIGALWLALLCPFTLHGGAPQMRVILPSLLLLGIEGAATVARA